MMLVKLKSVNGNNIAINPRNIVAVYEGEGGHTAQIITDEGGGYYEIAERFEVALSKINGALERA
ncbi:hypothetical protein [Achromobacter phage shaaii_LB5]|nr:hypothetical protein [Achromobacter phage shaaii_LB5]